MSLSPKYRLLPHALKHIYTMQVQRLSLTAALTAQVLVMLLSLLACNVVSSAAQC
jgi:hypothetical protein